MSHEQRVKVSAALNAHFDDSLAQHFGHGPCIAGHPGEASVCPCQKYKPGSRP